MLIYLLASSLVLGVLILMLFFIVSKNSVFDFLFNSSFECGFTSYFYSRFSFSMHYFMVGMIFLLLDLELCFLMPFINENYSSFYTLSMIIIFILTLILGLMEEWKEGLLDWKF